MECPICGFESIPGTEVCVQCHSQLTVMGGASGEVLSPPRAGRLKVFRPLRYFVNRTFDRLPTRIPNRLARVFEGSSVLPGTAWAAVFLSIIPGLGHLSDGRRRAALVVAGVWVGLAALTVNFFHGVIGGLLSGALLSWHACVAFDAGRARYHIESFRTRFRLVLFLLVLAGIGYFLLYRLVGQFVGLAESPFLLEAAGVEQGDVLLVRRNTSGLT